MDDDDASAAWSCLLVTARGASAPLAAAPPLPAEKLSSRCGCKGGSTRGFLGHIPAGQKEVLRT